MSGESYQIVVTGELVNGAYLPDVKAKLAVMFNTPAAKLDPLFSGKRVVIKKGLGEEAAQKYIAAVRVAGLICIAEATGVERAAKPAAVTLAPVGVTLVEAPSVAVPQIDASAFSMAPPGAIMDESPAVAAPEIDIGAISVAPLGGNLVEHAAPAAPAIDTGALSVAPPGAQLVELKSIVATVIDTSGLDLAPRGSDVGEMKRGEAQPLPDISHLKLT